MVTKNRIIAIVLIAGCLWGIWYFFPTRTRQVKRKLKAVCSWIEKDGPEKNLGKLQKAIGASKLFTDPCFFESEAHDISRSVSVNTISRYSLAGRSRFDKLSLKFYDINVSFSDDETASVEATARLSGLTTDGDKVSETHEVSCILKKTDDGWKINRVKLVQVLQK